MVIRKNVPKVKKKPAVNKPLMVKKLPKKKLASFYEIKENERGGFYMLRGEKDQLDLEILANDSWRSFLKTKKIKKKLSSVQTKKLLIEHLVSPGKHAKEFFNAPEQSLLRTSFMEVIAAKNLIKLYKKRGDSKKVREKEERVDENIRKFLGHLSWHIIKHAKRMVIRTKEEFPIALKLYPYRSGESVLASGVLMFTNSFERQKTVQLKEPVENIFTGEKYSGEIPIKAVHGCVDYVHAFITVLKYLEVEHNFNPLFVRGGSHSISFVHGHRKNFAVDIASAVSIGRKDSSQVVIPLGVAEEKRLLRDAYKSSADVPSYSYMNFLGV